jgi:hypothetical protein
MGIVKAEDVIAWEDQNGGILCFEHGNPDEDAPLTDSDFDEEDIVTCDQCGKRIQ